MKKIAAFLVIAFFICGVTLAFAADQDQKRSHDQKRLKDGSCQTDLTAPTVEKELAADRARDRKHDRRRDGSCQTDLTAPTVEKELAADRARDRKHDRKRDGSCRG